MRQGSSENSLHGQKLQVSSNSKSHLVELRALFVVNLGPEITPVHVSITGLFLNLSPIGQGASDDVAAGLLAYEGDVPLVEALECISHV